MNTLFPIRRRLSLLFSLLLVGLSMSLLSSCTTQTSRIAPTQQDPPSSATFPNGVASGDVTQTEAVLWARSTVTGPVTFTVRAEEMAEPLSLHAEVTDPMAPVTVTATSLTPGTAYTYQVANSAGDSAGGRVHTPTSPGVHTGLRFGAGGDWRGDMAPYPAMANAAGRDLDFFLLMGDAIYADIASPAVPTGQARTLAEFRRKFDEVYAAHMGSNTWAALRASTSLYVTIDDHEVLNDFAGGAEAARDGRFPETEGRINETDTYEDSLQALHDYHPLLPEFYGEVGGDGRMDGKRRLYRYRTFGSDAALIVTDSRSFRNLPLAGPDRHDPEAVASFREATFRQDRTMLGSQQLADLKADLLDARDRGVTWIFVAVSVPVQNRGLIAAQDRFEGFAAERTELLRFIEEEGICNVVFVAADIHGTLVNNVTYRLDAGGPEQPTGTFEVTVGPAAFYPALGEVVVQHGLDEGYVSEEEADVYRSLPVQNDMDDDIDDRDDWVKAKIDEELQALGHDTLGLAGSPIQAELRQGDYVAVEYFGWGEFEIDAESQSLTVTTYGIEPYSRQTLESDPEAVLARQPQVVSEFVVQPAACEE